MLLAFAVLGGCGVGYRVEPARLNVIVTTEDSKAQLWNTASNFLEQEGFENFGRYDGMSSLIQQSPMPKADKEEQLARLNRERTFLNTPRNLRIVWSDYANADIPKSSLPYTPSSNSFVEINVYEERPGGFSADGLKFYGRFLAALQMQYGASVVVVNEPPPTDDAEHYRITIVNTIGEIVGWFIAFFVPFVFTGLLSNYLLRHLNLPRAVRRIIFSVVNTWLVAPLPFQGGFIFVIPLPNLFAFPWTDSNFYAHAASYAAVSFPCALALCALASVFLIKDTEGSANFEV